MRVFIISILILFVACSEEVEPTNPDVNWTKDNSTNLNKNLAIQEEIDIKLFLERHKDWQMIKTGSGLQYYIYEEGSADNTYSPRKGNVADIEYKITLLDGTLVDQTEDNEYEEFVVDNSDIESGVQEAIKLLTIGDKAKLIIPSHLGHGLMGDMDKIPPLTTLIIDIYLTGIN